MPVLINNKIKKHIGEKQDNIYNIYVTFLQRFMNISPYKTKNTILV